MKEKDRELLKKFIQEHPNVYQKVVYEIDKYDQLINCSKRLELKIVRRLDKYIGTSIEKAKHNYVIYKIITSEISQAFKEKKKEHHSILFSTLAIDDFGESVEYNPEDTYTARVDSKVIGLDEALKKTVLLAKDDLELFTLNAWYQGYNDSEIAKVLAHRFNKNASSCRIRIQRFREKCQSKLSLA